MPKVHHVKHARKAQKDNGIKKGDPYYWWKFRYGGKRVSLTPPKRSQLTQSSFLSALYDLEDQEIDRLDLPGYIDSLKSELENLRDECQSSLDNMPEHLQESSESGMLLSERINSLEEWVDSLDGIDLSPLEDEELSEEEREQAVEDIVSEIESANPGVS